MRGVSLLPLAAVALAANVGDARAQAVNVGGSQPRMSTPHARSFDRAVPAGVQRQSPGNNIVADGQTATKIWVNGRTTTITTSTLSGGNAFNSFKTFSEAQGNTVNLIVPNAAGKLVNIVREGSVNILGTLNSYQHGKIGGNIVFVDSFGMVVGASGSVNVGSLTVVTPTQATVNAMISGGKVNDALVARVVTGNVPLSADGSVVIDGRVNATQSIKITAMDVRVAGSLQAAQRAAEQKARFAATVNTRGMQSGGMLVGRNGSVSIGGGSVAGGAVRTGPVRQAGTISIKAEKTVQVTGSLKAAGAAGRDGGKIDITAGGDIAIGKTANFNVAGVGKNSNAGTIFVKADNNLTVADGAAFNARGGTTGDGGFIELSASKTATLGRISVDLGATAGQVGTLFLDPLDLVVGAINNNYASFTPNITTSGNVILQADNSITLASDAIINTTSGTGNVSLLAPHITMLGGAKIAAGGSVFLTALATTGDASVSIGDASGSRATITGTDLTIRATAAGSDTVRATVLVTNADVTLTGNLDVAASATVSKSVNFVGAVASTNVLAAVDVLKGAVLNVGGNATLSASAKTTVDASGAPNTVSTKVTDAAAAVVDATSVARAHIGGDAAVNVDGALKLAADNTVTTTSRADASSSSRAGTTVAVTLLNADTSAVVDGSALITAGTLELAATSHVDANTIAKASIEGAGEADSGSKGGQYLSDAKYSEHAKTSDGGIKAAGALAIADVTSTTLAHMASSNVARVTGSTVLSSLTGNSSNVVADGSSATGSTGVGVAVGIGITHVSNKSLLEQKIETAALTLSATMDGTAADNSFSVTATSGAASSNVGVAGAVATNLLDSESWARFGSQDASLTPGGAVSITAAERSSASAVAGAAGAGTPGAKVGIGASVALNLVATRSTAELADGSKLTGAGDVTLQATGVHSVVTEAEQGAAGGVSITPVIATSIVSDRTKASIGALSGGLDATGNISVEATQASTALTQASGVVAGDKAAVGAALAIAVLDEQTIATTSSSIRTGGSVSFAAKGASLAATTAIASASGGKGTDDAGNSTDQDGSVDDKVQKQAAGSSQRMAAANIGDAGQRVAVASGGSQASGKSATSEGGVAVAAAIAVDVSLVKVQAYVPSSVGVAAGGALSVATVSNVDAKTSADGSTAGGGKAGVGAAVAINVVNVENRAELGVAAPATSNGQIAGVIAGRYGASELNVSALKTDLGFASPLAWNSADLPHAPSATTALGRVDQIVAYARSGASGAKVSVAGSLAVNVLTSKSIADIASDVMVSISPANAGAVVIAADHEAYLSASALPAEDGANGSKIGVGASVALNTALTSSEASLKERATLSGANSLSVKADSHLDSDAQAEAGAKGGTALDAVVAFTILSETTKASIESGSTLSVGDFVEVHATSDGTHSALASGSSTSSGSGGTAIGGAAALITGTGLFNLVTGAGGPVTSETTASIARNVSAGGDLDVAALGTHTYSASATATASGGSELDKGSEGGSKSTSSKTLGSAPAGDSMKQEQKGLSDNKGGSSGGKLSVAAAVGATIVGDNVKASLGDGLTIHAGSVSVKANSTDQVQSLGNAASVSLQQDNGIGMGAALTIVGNKTEASIGNAAHIVTDGAIAVGATSTMNNGLGGFTAEAMSGASGKKLAVAGALAIGISNSSTSATVGNNFAVDRAGDAFTRAGAVSVTALNTSSLAAKAWSGSYSGGGTGVGASIAAAISNDSYKASIGDTAEINAASVDVSATNARVDNLFSTLNSLAQPITAALQDVNNTVTGYVTDANTLVKGVTDASKATDAVSSFKTGFAERVTTDKNKLLDTLRSAGTLTRDLPLLGSNNFYTEVVAGAASTDKLAVAGGLALQIMLEKTSATIGDGARIDVTNAVSVSAADNAISRTLVGALAGSGGQNAAGISLGIVVNKGNVDARIGAGSTISQSSGIGVAAAADHSIELFELAAAAANANGIAGILGVVYSDAAVNASTGVGSSLNSTGLLNVAATNKINTLNLAGGIAIGGKNGIGGVLISTTINNSAIATIDSSALRVTTVDAGSVSVSSKTDEQLINVGVAGAAAGENAISGVATPLIQVLTSQAGIGNNAIVTARTGDVKVTAADDVLLVNVAGVIAVGGNNGIGAAIAYGQITDTVKAYIGDDVTLDAAGNVNVTAREKAIISDAVVSGAAGSNVAVTGALASSVVIDNVSATIGKRSRIGTTIRPSGVLVSAEDKTLVIDLAGAIAAAGNTGVGASVDANVLTKKTTATIDDSAVVYSSGDVVVRADSEQKVFSLVVGFAAGSSAGVAGSVGTYVLVGETLANIAGGADIRADGNVGVIANDANDLTRLVGSGAIGGNAGVGGAIGVSVAVQTTKATISDLASVQALGLGGTIGVTTGIGGEFSTYLREALAVLPVNLPADSKLPDRVGTDINAVTVEDGLKAGGSLLVLPRKTTPIVEQVRGVAVAASATSALRSMVVSGSAAGTAGVSISGDLPVVVSNTEASIGSRAKINSATNDAPGANQSVTVAASSDLYHLGVAGAVAGGGTAGVGGSSETAIITNTTTAAIGQGADVKAARNVAVTAKASENFAGSAVSGAAGGTAGVAGGLTGFVLVSNTKAIIDSDASKITNVVAGGNVIVTADDQTRAVLTGGTIGIGAGAAGVGMGVGLAVVVKTTEATIGASANVTGLGNGTDNDFREYTGADFSTTRLGRGVLVAANSGQSFAGIVGAGAGGLYAGVAGAVAVEVFVDQTRATIGQNAVINGTNAGANSNQDVIVTARNSTVVSMAEGTVAVGLAGVGGAVDVAVIADATSARIGDGATVNAARDVGVVALTNRQTASTVASVAGGAGGVGAAISVLAIANGPNADQTAKMDSGGRSLTGESNALLSNDVIDRDFLSVNSTDANVKDASKKAQDYKTGLTVQKTLPTGIAPGNSATIGNAAINAGSNVNVRARDSVNALIADGAVMIGAGLGAGIGIAVIDVANTATITNGARVTAGGVDVAALSDRTMTGAGIAATATGVAAALVSLTDVTSTKASVNQSTINALGSVQVRASNNEQIRIATTTLAAGAAGGLSLVVIKPTTEARIDGGSTINAATGVGGGVAVNAGNTVNIISGAAGVAVGGGGVGLTIVTELLTTKAVIGAGSTVTSGVTIGTPTAGDVLVSATTQETLLSVGAGVALGEGLGGALTIIARDENTTAEIENATVTATGNVGVIANSASADDLAIGGAAVGGGAGVGGSVGVTVLNSTVKASIAANADVTALGLGSDLTYVKDYQTSFSAYGGNDTIKPATLEGVSGGADLQAPVTTDDVSKIGSLLLLQKGTIGAVTSTARGVVVNAAKAQSVRSIAVSGGVGGFLGVGLSGNVPVIVGTTSASIGNGAKINQRLTGSAGALQSVVVAAANQTYALNIVGAVAGGGAAGIGASLSTVVVANNTSATIGENALVSAKNNVAVTALAGEDLAMVAAAGAAGGYVGVAGGLSLISIDNTTRALIDKNAVVVADNNVIVAANDVTREATFAGSIVLSGGGAVGAAVSVGLINKQTTATIDSGARVSGLARGTDTFVELTGGDVTASRTGKGVLVDAQSVESAYVFALGGGAGAFVAAAGAIGVNIFNTNTFATINSGATINGVAGGTNQQDVAVTARNLAGIVSANYGVALSGLVSLAGGADIGVLNSNVGASIGDATINAGNDVLINAIANKAINSTAVSAAASSLALSAGVSVYAIGNGVDPNGRATIELKTSDASGGSVTNYAGKTLSVGGDLGTLTTGTATAANKKNSGSSTATVSAGDASTTLNTRLGAINVSGKMTAQNALAAGTSATMGSANVTAAGAVKVNGNDQVAYVAKTGTLSVGGVGIGAGIGIYTNNATTTATVTGTGNGGTISANAMSVAALTGRSVNLTSYAGSFALLGAVQADVALVSDNSVTRAGIVNYAISQSGGLTVSAASNRQLSATGSGVAAALGFGIGASIANASIGGSVDTTLQDVDIGTSTVRAGAVTAQATSNDSANASALASAGGLGGAGTGAESNATVSLPVTLTLSNNTIYAGAVSLLARATDSANATSRGVALAGVLAAGGSVANATVSPQVAITMTGGLIDATSLQSDAQALSGGTNAAAYGASGAALVGVNATSATARDTSQAIATGTGGIIRTSGALNFNARTVESISANASGLAFGLVALGGNVALATTDRTTKATFVNMTQVAGWSVGLAAESFDTTRVTATSGSGGVIAGAASDAKTISKNRTVAEISGGVTRASGGGGTGMLSLVARHTETFSGSADTLRSAFAGRSGARLSHDVNSAVSAGFGDNVNVAAGNLLIDAANSVTRAGDPSGWDVRSGSGGFLDAAAAAADTKILVTTTAGLGKNARVHLIELASGFGTAKVYAANDVVAQASTKVDAAGVISVARGEATVKVDATATVAFDEGSSLIVDVGNLTAGAWSNVNVDARTAVTTNEGVTGAPDGLVVADVTVNDILAVRKNVRLEATSGVIAADGATPTEGNIWLSAGKDLKRDAVQAISLNAVIDLYNKTVFPIDAVPNAQAKLTSNALVTVSQSDAPEVPDTKRYGVNAAGDIALFADQGLMSTTATGTGTNIYLQGLSKVGSAISEFFGGGPVSFDKKGGTATKLGSSMLVIDGVVVTGTARNKNLLITYDKRANCDPTMPSCVVTVGNIKYESDTFRAGGAILERLGQIDALLELYKKDTIALAAYSSERVFLEDKLVALGLASIDANGAFKLNSEVIVGSRVPDSAKLVTLTNALNLFKTDVSTSIGAVLGDGLNNIALAWDGTNLAGATVSAFLPYAVTTNVESALLDLKGLSKYDTIKGELSSAGDSFRKNLTDINLQLASGTNELSSARQYVIDIKNLAAGIDSRVAEIVGNQQAVAQGNKSFASAQTELATSFSGITSNQTLIVDANSDFLTSVSSVKTSADAISNYLSAIKTAATPVSPTTNDNAINAALVRTDSNIANTGAFTRIDQSRQYMGTVIEGGALPSDTATPTAITGLRATIDDYAAKVATPVSGKSVPDWETDLNAKAQDAAASGVLGIGKDSVVLQLANTGVQLGNIYLTAQTVKTETGTGKIFAPGDASINITNETAATLKIQNLNIPVSSGGRISVNNVDIRTASEIGAVTGKPSGFANGNIVTSNGFGGAQINIFSNYNPESITYYDPDSTKKYLNTLQMSPDIMLLPAGTINNPAGAVNITSQAGNVYINGKINAGSISIVARNGDLVTSYVNGFNHVGGDPVSGAVPGAPVVAGDSISTGLGLIANGQVFLSARYLNINSTVQSGIANWTLDLTPNTQLVTKDASRIGGLNPNTINDLMTTYRGLPSKVGVPTTADVGNGVTLNLLTGELTFSIATVQASRAAGSLNFTGSYKFVATDSKVSGVYQAQAGASYDAEAGQVAIDGTSVRGGYIKILGQIVNTNEGIGYLNVLDGFGSININNTTGVPVVLSTLNTGADASGIGRGTQGVIDITDVRINRLDRKVVDATHTVFTRDYDFATNTGKVVVTQEQGILNEHTGVFEANPDGILQATASTTGNGDRTAVYNPMVTQRYVYTTAADYAVTKNLSATGGSAVVQQGAETKSSSVNMLSGSYVFIDYDNIQAQVVNGKNSYVLASTAPTLPTDIPTTQTYAKNDTPTQTQTGSANNCNLLTACAPASNTVYYKETTEFRQISSRSLKADYPIKVNFIGSNTGTINVTSNRDIILKGNVTNVAGTTTITANGAASIIQGSASPTITAQSINLTAGKSIGTVAAGNVTGQPVKVALTDLDGVRGRLDAFAANGVVAIKADRDLIVGQVKAGGLARDGKSIVMLSAGTSISAAPDDSLIQADMVSLTALTGSIGSVAGGKELNVNTGFTTDQSLRPFGDPATMTDLKAYYGLSASASGDINIHAGIWDDNASATILANSIVSTGGNVKLTTVGQVLDGNPIQQIDTKTYLQLVSYWESLGLIGAGVVTRDNAAIQAYEQSETQAYKQYWQVRLGQPNGGAAFDPTYQISYSGARYQSLDAYYRNFETTKNPGASAADIDARVAASIAKQAADDTARYRALNSKVGSLTSSFDDSYTYTMTVTEKTKLTAGTSWTEKTLGFPLAAGALKTVTNTNTVIKAPNVSGRNVTILAAGGVGETVIVNGAPTPGIKILPTLTPLSTLTDAEKVALATAERSDLELTINGVVLPTNATAEQLAAYQAAVAAGIANVSTTIRLGVDESQMGAAERAALNAAAAGIADRGPGTYLSVLSKRPLNVAGSESLNVTVTKPVSSGNIDQGKAYIASRGNLKLGDIAVTGETRIKAIGSLINVANSSIRTGNIVLESATGAIGGTPPLVLNLRQGATITARALGLVNLSAEAGNVNGSIDANIDTIYSPNLIKVQAEGSILNAINDMQVNILGGNIQLIADSGSIGSLTRSLNVGTSPGGVIDADARNDLINLYGVGGLDFTIGSAFAGSSTKLVAAGDGKIDGPVTAGTDIALSAGGRWTMTASTNVVSAAGDIQLSADVLKMLRGARMAATVGSVRVDTVRDALVTGISAGSDASNAIEVTSGGHILAGGDPARLYDLRAMAPGAGIKLTAMVGIGDQTWADRFAKDQAGSPAGSSDLITAVANPLRILTSKADLKTVQQSSAYVDATISEWLKLTSPQANIWADNRSPRPVLGYDVQLFQPSKQFYLYQSGARSTTNAYVVQYGERAEVIASGNSTRSGGSMVRDIDRILTPTGVGSVLLRDDSPDLNGPFFHGDAYFHFMNSLRDRKVRSPLKGRAVNLKGLAFAVTIGD